MDRQLQIFHLYRPQPRSRMVDTQVWISSKEAHLDEKLADLFKKTNIAFHDLAQKNKLDPFSFNVVFDYKRKFKNASSSYAYEFFQYLLWSRRERIQTKCPKAFQLFHNYTRNICDGADEKSPPY